MSAETEERVRRTVDLAILGRVVEGVRLDSGEGFDSEIVISFSDPSGSVDLRIRVTDLQRFVNYGVRAPK